MTEFISSFNLTGLATGIVTFLIIGLFHPIVIKAEYYWGTSSWWVFLIGGIVACIGSIIVSHLFWSIVLGVIAFSSFWSIKEVFEQRQRVLKGWFPMNPKRRHKYRAD